MLSPAPQAAAAGLLHALVDLGSAYLLFHELGGYAPEARNGLILLYNTLAFAGQVPAGWWVDRRGAARSAAVAGLALIAAALGLAPLGPAAAVVVVGAGNALFHVGAGAQVLRRSEGRAAESGIFVGPGAIGLSAGIWLGTRGFECRALLTAAAFAGSLACAWVLEPERPAASRSPAGPGAAPWRAFAWLAGAALLGSVAVRAFTGGTVSAFWREADPSLLAWLATAAALGKITGGLAADRLGWLPSSAVALALAAPLLSAFRTQPIAALVGMALLQSTMPVTLKAIHRLVPHRPGLAFGLPCSALLLGALAGIVPGEALHSTGGLALALVASTVLVSSALAAMARRRAAPVEGLLADAPDPSP